VAATVTSMPRPSAVSDAPRGRVKTLAELERDHIAHVLRVASGNVMAAAKMLGISRARLYRKMSQYGVERPSEAS
jgi:DNA-binding NtrC family response regulator